MDKKFIIDKNVKRPIYRDLVEEINGEKYYIRIDIDDKKELVHIIKFDKENG